MIIPIYTHFSDSHKILYEDFFKTSLRKLYSKEEVNIRVLKQPQDTENGKFMENGWLKAMQYKLDVILRGIDEQWGKQFIFADCDIQFFKPFVDDIINELQDNDLVAQEDCSTLCAGFFGCNCNDSTRNLFKKINQNYKNMVNDQVALNTFKDDIKYKLLSKTKYFTIGNFFNNVDGTHVWDNISNIDIPPDIVLHHGNYVVGIENKMALMKMVRSQYENKEKK